jgi:hypothetical protein
MMIMNVICFTLWDQEYNIDYRYHTYDVERHKSPFGTERVPDARAMVSPPWDHVDTGTNTCLMMAMCEDDSHMGA